MDTNHSDTSWVSGNTSTGSPYLDGTATYISNELQNLEDSVSQAIFDEDGQDLLSSRTGTFVPGRDTSGRRSPSGSQTGRMRGDTYRSSTREFTSAASSKRRKAESSAGQGRSRSSRDTEIITRIRNLESGVSGYEQPRGQDERTARPPEATTEAYGQPSRRIENASRAREGTSAVRQGTQAARQGSYDPQASGSYSRSAPLKKTTIRGTVSRGKTGSRSYSGGGVRKGRRKALRRKKRLLRRLTILVLLAAVITGVVLLLRGCQTREVRTITRSTVELRRNGSLIVTSIEPFERDYYDEKELKDQIDEALGMYNLNGKRIELNRFDVDGKNAFLQLTYHSSEDYRAFNDTLLFDGTIADAQQQGIDLSAILSAVSRRNSSRIFTSGDFTSLSGNKVIVLAEAMDIVLPRRDKILYASANLTVTDDQHAEVSGEVTRSSFAVVVLE